MSESFSRVLYPFEVARQPSLEPEVRRAILSRWSSSVGVASDSLGTEDRPRPERRPPDIV